MNDGALISFYCQYLNGEQLASNGLPATRTAIGGSCYDLTASIDYLSLDTGYPVQKLYAGLATTDY